MYSYKQGIARQTASSTSIPAPIGGLNDRDSLADMPATDAVILENWWVQPSKLSTRQGYVNWATGFSSAVETLVNYSPPSGNTKIFAASAGNIYDITSTGAIGTPVVTGKLSNQWQQVAASTPGGNFVYLFNGVDSPLLYDGSTWLSVTGTSTTAITGVTTSTLMQGCLYKNRLFMVQKDTMKVWYLPIQSVGGAASSFNLGTVFQRGGYLVGMYTWTIDAGNGSDDQAVFISSNGEVAVYAGSDPTTSTGFYLVGVYFLGRPMGRRPAVKFGGDLLIICEQGLFPLSQGLLTATIDRSSALTDKIQNTISSVIQQYPSNFGWEVCLYPNQNALILNVPAGNGANYQLLQNTISRAWTKFTGWNASCWVDTKLGLLYGDSNSVKSAWTGNVDGTSMISCDALQAFQYFGSPSKNKDFKMVKPYIRSNGIPSILYGINGDFNPVDVTGSLSYLAPTGMTWGLMYWGTMQWGGDMRQISNWNSVGGVYKAAALRMKVQNNGAQSEWASTDFVFQEGGII